MELKPCPFCGGEAKLQHCSKELPFSETLADSTLTATVRPSAAEDTAGSESIGSSIYKEE